MSTGGIIAITLVIVSFVEINAKRIQHAQLLSVAPHIVVGGQKELVTI